MTSFATQSNIDMGGPGLLGSDVSGASRRKSKLITIGAGLTLSGGNLVNTLDLTPYALLPDVLPIAGTLLSYGGSRQLAAGGTVTHSGALNLGANALTVGAITASGVVTGTKFVAASGQTAPYTVIDFYGDAYLAKVVSGAGLVFEADTMTLRGLAGASNLNLVVSGTITASGALTGTSIALAPGSLQSGGLSFGGFGGANIYGRGQQFVFGTANANALEISYAYTRVARESWIGWSDGSYDATNNTVRVSLYADAVGTLSQRNGLNAQCFDLFETYTSGTNNGKLRFKATSSGHQIGSARASSGSNRAVQLGHFDASGVFTAGITVATTGLTTIYTPSDVAFGLTLDSASMGFFYMRPTWDGSGVWRFGPSTNAYRTRFNGMTEFRVEAGASRTITENQHITFEMVSDTAGNLVYRGSDGTTRRMGMDFDTTAVNYLPLSGGTLTGALSLGANALTCGAITASGNIILSASNATISNSNDTASDGIKLTTGGINIFRNTNDFASLDYPNYLGLRLVAECGVSWTSSGLGTLGPQDTSLSRNAAGVVQIGTTAHNASGSLLLTNLTASGYVSAGASANMVTVSDHNFVSRAVASTANSGSIVDVASNTGHTGRLQSWTRAGTVVAAIENTGNLTCGTITASGRVTVPVMTTWNNLTAGGGIVGSGGVIIGTISTNQFLLADSVGTYRAFSDLSTSGYFNIDKDMHFGWATVTGQAYNSSDVRLYRYAPTSALNVQAAGGLRVLNLVGSADAPLTCGAITASDNVTVGGSIQLSWGGGGAILKSLSGQTLSLRANNSLTSHLTIGTDGFITAGEGQFTGSVYFNTTGGITYVRGSRTVVLGSANPGNAQISSDYTGVANTATLTIGDPSGGYSKLACGAITASGNVGIGTASLTAPLNVQAASSGALGIDIYGRVTNNSSLINFYTNAGASQSYIASDSANGLSIAQVSNLAMHFYTNNVERLTIANSGAITASGPVQETPTQSALDPTTSDIPAGKRMGWYNSTTGEFRDWVNIGGTLKKSAAYT